MFDNHEFSVATSMPLITSHQQSPQPMRSTLSWHEKITNKKASDCYKYYKPRLKDKSWVSLDSELNFVLRQKYDTIVSYHRPLIVALLFAEACNKKKTDRLTSYTLAMNDVSVAHYALKCDELTTQDALWSCRSIAMAQLLLTYGANTTNNISHDNILHYWCTLPGTFAKPIDPIPSLIQFYATTCPALIEAQNCSKRTPLLECIEAIAESNDQRRGQQALQCACTLLNLGARTDISVGFVNKTPYKILVTMIQSQYTTKEQKAKLLELATYIKNPPKTHSTLYDLILDQWQDELDLDETTQPLTA